jgi:predicted ATP-dependent protease
MAKNIALQNSLFEKNTLMLKKLNPKDVSVEFKDKDFVVKNGKHFSTEYFIFQEESLKVIRQALDNPEFYPHFIITGQEGSGKRSGILSLLKKEYSKKNTDKKYYYSRQTNSILENPSNSEGLTPLFDIEKSDTPIIYDPTPNTMSLVGIPAERKYHPGNLVKAYGGYLILPLFKMVSEPNVFDVLKSCLLNGTIDFINLPEVNFFQYMDRTLPQFPINVRVILIGEEYLVEQLLKKDMSLGDVFKLKIDLEYESDLNEKNIKRFSVLLDSLAKDGYPTIDTGGKKRLFEEALIQNESKTKFSLNVTETKSIYEEAMVLFKNRKNKSKIGEKEIQEALDTMDRRFSLPRKKYYEDLKSGIYNITLSGSRLGRINGLSIFTPFGTFQEYGQVNVISSRALMGTGTFINIEREVNLSGDVHDKGVFILQSYLKGLFSNFPSLGVDISILFEQNHTLVDGDSATIAELLASLSALSGIEIPCNIAITGSMSQYGEVMSVGAITQKVEAWCEITKLLGDKKTIYKVFIPHPNTKDLILSRNVRAAMAGKNFSVYSFSHVSEVIPEIMGLELGTIGKDGHFTKGSLLRLIEDKLEPKKEIDS